MDVRFRPYPASWVDRLIDAIDGLPGPPWVAYAVIFLAAAAVVQVAGWIDGFAPVGSVDPFLLSYPFYLVVMYSAIDYLDRAAARAWGRFRPAANVDDAEAERIVYELTTMPAGPTLVWTIPGVILPVVFAITQYGRPLDLAEEPVTLVVGTAMAVVAFAGFGVLLYHTVRQLARVSRLHEYVDVVDVLHLAPLHAFSGVTAATGAVLLLGAYFTVLTVPSLTNPAVVGPLAATGVLAIACFVAPLNGMHQLIVAEKGRRLQSVGTRLAAAMADLERRNDAGDLGDADAVNKNINSLIAERDLLLRTPTWPWAPETLRGFSTALVLPIVLWFVLRLLERVVA